MQYNAMVFRFANGIHMSFPLVNTLQEDDLMNTEKKNSKSFLTVLLACFRNKLGEKNQICGAIVKKANIFAVFKC
jgi:hypothetical protein